MYNIEKIIFMGDIELLPEIVDTPIWKDFDQPDCSKTVKLAAALYDAIFKRENYFQLNTPTAFGNSQYTYYCGLVNGILQGSGMEESVAGDHLVFKKGTKKILVIDKVKRPRAFLDAVRDNREMLNQFGL